MIVIDKDVMVPMTDGVRLATDVFRLQEAPPSPVLLVRTPTARTLEASKSPAADFPKFDRNSNAGGDIIIETADQYQPPVNRVLHDQDHHPRSGSSADVGSPKSKRREAGRLRRR
jgi:predicted acyl esterase